MPSRFDKAPDKSPVLSPQLVEAVERQAERRRAEATEREQLADARVQNFAERLGISPDEVRKMAEEESLRLATSPQPASVKISRNTLHAIYITALVIVGAWGYAGRVVAGRSPLLPFTGTFSPPPKAVVVQETFPVDAGLVSPPKGLKASVDGYRTKHSVFGLQGKTPRTPASAIELKKSIRALLRWEETAYGSNLAFQEKGFTSPTTGQLTPYPAPGGWHAVTLTNGTTYVTGELPDRSYAENFQDFERDFNDALDELVDKRFFPQMARDASLPDPESLLTQKPAAPTPKPPLGQRFTEGIERIKELRERK